MGGGPAMEFTEVTQPDEYVFPVNRTILGSYRTSLCPQELAGV